MTSVLDALTKLPRYVHVLSTNGIDQNNAIVLATDTNTNTITKESKVKDKPKKKYSYEHHRRHYLKNREKLLGYCHRYYREHRDKILEKKRAHNALPEVKEKRAAYAKLYYKRTKDKR